MNIEPLSGGLLNHVYRIRTDAGSVVVKRAGAQVRVAPGVALSSERLHFEARALRLFDGGKLASLASDAIRPPRLLRAQLAVPMLILEDLGEVAPITNRESAQRLGTFIGALHRMTRGDQELTTSFVNLDVQRVRKHVQYDDLGARLVARGHRHGPTFAARATALGERFLGAGECLIMGDLWPASVVTTRSGVRVIDWELAHYGHPAQDVGHWLAHAWLGKNEALRDGFLSAYGPLGDDVKAAACVHAACEILMRTIGVFATADNDTSAIDSAVSLALDQRWEMIAGPRKG